MKKELIQYIIEASEGKGLTIFDIDDTMFTSNARVRVKNNNTGQTKELTPKEYNNYKLQKGEEWDYGEFKSSKIFYKTATPIGKMVTKFKAILRNATKRGSKVILVTARADMDDRDLFLKTFEANGYPLKDVYIERAGNLGLDSSAKNKEIVFRKYLDTGKYKRIRLFDDHIENLYALLKLSDEYQDIQFEAYRVKKDGSIKTMKLRGR